MTIRSALILVHGDIVHQLVRLGSAPGNAIGSNTLVDDVLKLVDTISSVGKESATSKGCDGQHDRPTMS
jgi:hypothetical protein